MDLEARDSLPRDQVVGFALEDGVVAVALARPVVNEEALNGSLLLFESLHLDLLTIGDVALVERLASLTFLVGHSVRLSE